MERNFVYETLHLCLHNIEKYMCSLFMKSFDLTISLKPFKIRLMQPSRNSGNNFDLMLHIAYSLLTIDTHELLEWFLLNGVLFKHLLTNFLSSLFIHTNFIFSSFVWAENIPQCRFMVSLKSVK